MDTSLAGRVKAMPFSGPPIPTSLGFNSDAILRCLAHQGMPCTRGADFGNGHEQSSHPCHSEPALIGEESACCRRSKQPDSMRAMPRFGFPDCTFPVPRAKLTRGIIAANSWVSGIGAGSGISIRKDSAHSNAIATSSNTCERHAASTSARPTFGTPPAINSCSNGFQSRCEKLETADSETRQYGIGKTG